MITLARNNFFNLVGGLSRNSLGLGLPSGLGNDTWRGNLDDDDDDDAKWLARQSYHLHLGSLVVLDAVFFLFHFVLPSLCR